MITAKEARDLAGPTVEEKVVGLSETILKLASEGKRALRTSYDYDGNKELWITGGYNTTDEWKNAKKILEGFGYSVKYYYSEGSQFADAYTLIEW